MENRTHLLIVDGAFDLLDKPCDHAKIIETMKGANRLRAETR
jgi:hypothetical protein